MREELRAILEEETDLEISGKPRAAAGPSVRAREGGAPAAGRGALLSADHQAALHRREHGRNASTRYHVQTRDPQCRWTNKVGDPRGSDRDRGLALVRDGSGSMRSAVDAA